MNLPITLEAGTLKFYFIFILKCTPIIILAYDSQMLSKYYFFNQTVSFRINSNSNSLFI